MNECKLQLGKNLKNPFNGKAELGLIDAYFLGAMLSNFEESLGDDCSPRRSSDTWVFSYRLNKTKTKSDRQIALDDQKNQVTSLLERVEISSKNQPISVKSVKSGGAHGYQFAVRLPKKITLNYLYKLCDKITRNKDKRFAGALLVGTYDCKSYLDNTGKYLAIDCPAVKEADILKKCLAKFNIEKVNYNPKRTRNTPKPRKPQLRIKFKQLAIFICEIGWTWEFKHIAAIECIPQEKDLLQRGRVAQLILNTGKNNCSTALINEDQPLLDALSQDLSEIDEQTRKSVETPDTPKDRLSNYVYLSSDKRQKRDALTVKESLVRCGWKCEIGTANTTAHETFLRLRDGEPYLEPHHLIPLKSRNRFEYEIDCSANVVMLCSKCHDEIHYGVNREQLITELFKSRKSRLEAAGLLVMVNGEELDAANLIEMY